MACISDNELVELLEGRLAAPRRAHVIEEITACTSCRELLHDCLLASTGVATSGAPLPAELGGYVVGEVLGAGAGGVVVRARDPVLEREVALKLVPTAGDDPAALALREARTLATVRHPAVVQVYATGSAARFGYVAMELVAGESLAARLARAPVRWRDAVRWFIDVADGLAAIHATGLVHRDLKPGNLLVDGDRLRIVDFGLAARVADTALAGTLPYLAPEVLGGAPANARSDIYSLFVSLFEVIAGHRPYRELDVRALRAAAERCRPDWPAHVPVAVRRVVEAGLHPDPTARIADATAARRALVALVAPRRRLPIAALAIAVGIAIVVIAARSSPRGDACDVSPRAWREQLALRAPLVRARLSAYADDLEREQVAARNAGGRVAQRACLEQLDQRAAALVAEGGLDVDVERALVELPAPAACASSAAVAPEAPAATAAIASARAALARRDAHGALARLGALDSAQAELVRGAAHLDLRDHAAAAAAWRRAAERAAIAGRDDLVAEANNGLAAAIGIGDHQWAAGEAYAVAARTTALRVGDRVQAGVARRMIGWLVYLEGDAPRGQRELTSAVDELRAAEAPVQVAIAEQKLGRIALRRGDLASARTHVERAFELRRDALGPEHPDTIELESDRAAIDSADGHADRARDRLRREIARLDAVYGTDHPALAGPWTELGRALAAAGDYSGADAALSRTLAIDRAHLGELDRDTGDAYANLAQLRVIEARVSEAIELYRGALASIRSVTGGDHPDLAPVYAGLAVAFGTVGRYGEAADAEGHAIELWRAHPGHDEELARALSARALIELGENNADEARRDAEDSLTTLARLHGDDHVALAPALFALAQSELAAGHLDAARAAVEHALTLHARAGARPRVFVEERWLLGQILWRQGHRAEGVDATRRALSELGDDDRALADRLRAWLRAPS